jgi:FkbM family methyltransferase
VEPVPALFALIQENANIRKFNYAISSSNEDILINLPANRCPSTRLLPEDSKTIAIFVCGVTLEAFIRENEIRVIDLLKVDIEGSEIELFQTIDPASLAAIGQITVEFHDFIFSDSHMAVEEIKREIRKHGFYCIPFSRDNTDILFVNKRLIKSWEYLYLKLIVRNYRGLLRIIARRLHESRGN